MKRRKEVELTQQKLANIVGVAVRTVQGWESGEYIPSLTPVQFWRLCKALNYSAEDLAREFSPEAFDVDEDHVSDQPGDLATN